MDLSRPLKVVTPTLDGDVLTALALADAWFTPGRLHKVMGRHSEDGVRRVLGRLAEQGVVLTLNGGNAILYQLNRQHLAAGAIVQLANLREELVTRLVAALDRWVDPPRYAALFGSAAVGRGSAQSDIDIFLVRPREARIDDDWDDVVMRLETDVSIWTGNDARVLSMTEDHVRTHASDEPVISDVVKEGIFLIGDANWLAQQIQLSRRG